MRAGRLWVILGLVAVVAAILLGYRFRVMMAGGRALFMFAVIGGLVWLAMRQDRPVKPPSPDLDKDRKDVG